MCALQDELAGSSSHGRRRFVSALGALLPDCVGSLGQTVAVPLVVAVAVVETAAASQAGFDTVTAFEPLAVAVPALLLVDRPRLGLVQPQ